MSASELVGFLRDSKEEVRKLAIQSLASLSGSEEGRRTLMALGDTIYTESLRLLTDVDSIAHDCYALLINVCEEPAARDVLLKKRCIPMLVERTVDPKNKHASMAGALLNNLTQTQEGCYSLLDIDEDDDEEDFDPMLMGFLVAKLLGLFLREHNDGAWKKESPDAAPSAKPGHQNVTDTTNFVAQVLRNLTQTKLGRDFILDEDRHLLKHLLPSLSHSSILRRRGVVHIFRNCLLESQHHEYLIHTIEVLPYLLVPLIGPEPFDDDDLDGMPEIVQKAPKKGKTIEPDILCRRALLECLYLFCATRDGRDELRAAQVYPVLRLLGPSETDEKCNEWIINLVEAIILDEEEDEKKKKKKKEAAEAAGAAGEKKEVEVEEEEEEESGIVPFDIDSD